MSGGEVLIDLVSDEDEPGISTVPNGNECHPRIVSIMGGVSWDLKASDHEPASTSAPAGDKCKPTSISEPVDNNKEPPVKRAKLDNGSSDTGADNSHLFKTFTAECAKFETNEHDRRRVEEKLQRYFDKTSSQYLNSKAFGDLLKKETQSLNADRLYYCLKTVLDELKHHWLSRRIQPIPVAGCSKSVQSSSDEEETCETTPPNPDEQRIKKLVFALDKVHRKILKLEQEEVNLDDETHSAYLRMSRYRQRITKIYKLFSKVTGEPAHAESIAKKRIRFNGTCYPKVNLAVERWVNKKRVFPDYADVYNLIKYEDFGVPPHMVSTVSQEVFQKIGELLQKLRKLDYSDSIEGLVSDDRDPAKEDPILAAKLEENKKLFKKKEQELIDFYAKRQAETKDKKDLEPDEDEKSEDEEKEDSDSDVSSRCSVEIDDILPDTDNPETEKPPAEQKPENDGDVIVIDC